MRKLFICLMLVIVGWFQAYTITGTLKNAPDIYVSLKASNGVGFKLLSIAKTDAKGHFLLDVPTNFEGLLSLVYTKNNLIFLADGKNDITFSYDEAQQPAIVFEPQSINDLYFKWIENGRPQQEDKSPFALLDFYENGVTNIFKYQTLSSPDNIGPYMTEMSQFVARAPYFFETTDLLQFYSSTYLMYAAYISKKTDDPTQSMFQQHIDRLLDASVVDTERGQKVLSIVLDQLKAMGKDDLLDHYIASAEGMNCELSDDLKAKIQALNVIKVGSVFPNMKLPSPNQQLYNLKTDYTILLFWSPLCSHCVTEFPIIKNVYPTLKEKHGELVAISLESDFDAYQQMVKDTSWINLYDKDNVLSIAYAVSATPTFVVLDKAHVILGTSHNIEQAMDLIP